MCREGGRRPARRRPRDVLGHPGRKSWSLTHVTHVTDLDVLALNLWTSMNSDAGKARVRGRADGRIRV